MSKKFQCSYDGCEEPSHLGRLCEEHHANSEKNKRLREAALNALHSGMVGDRLPDDAVLKEELMRLRKWWDRACNSINYQVQDEVLFDEAKYAIEWCISLAQEIVMAEQAKRVGEEVACSLQATRAWVWERFSNLESGLMSNGINRRSQA